MKFYLPCFLVLLAGCPDPKQSATQPSQQPTVSSQQPITQSTSIDPLDVNADLGVPKDAKPTGSHASGSPSGSNLSASIDNYVPSHFDAPRYTKENWRTWEYRKGNSVKSLRRKYENGKWLYRLEVNVGNPPTITYFEAEDAEAAEKDF